MTAASVVSNALAMTAPAENAFRCRWRLSTLARINPKLHDRLAEQIGLYDTALVTGTDAEVREHAAAMVRGWRAACAALEAPLQADDAYQVGIDYHTGLHVVIADQKGSIARVQVKDGHRAVFVTPDEVAKMMSAWTIVSETKALFPDAEIVSVTVEG